MNSIATMLRDGAAAITGTSPTAALDARVLLKWAADITDTDLIIDTAVADTAARRYRTALARRAAGEPVAYITGRKEFYGRDFAVTPGVFVPRPETELLVDVTLEAVDAVIGSGDTVTVTADTVDNTTVTVGTVSDTVDNTTDTVTDTVSVVDLGTGSGVVAITIALARPGWRVIATDTAADAIAVARTNAIAHAATVTVTDADWLRDIGDRHTAIIANPPYIADADPCIAADGIRHEPRAALTAGRDGLSDLAQIITAAPAHLHTGGVLVLEHGATQAVYVRAMMRRAGLGNIKTHRDLAGCERVTSGVNAT